MRGLWLRAHHRRPCGSVHGTTRAKHAREYSHSRSWFFPHPISADRRAPSPMRGEASRVARVLTFSCIMFPLFAHFRLPGPRFEQGERPQDLAATRRDVLLGSCRCVPRLSQHKSPLSRDSRDADADTCRATRAGFRDFGAGSPRAHNPLLVFHSLEPMPRDGGALPPPSQPRTRLRCTRERARARVFFSFVPLADLSRRAIARSICRS